jgi:hypothetical protein
MAEIFKINDIEYSCEFKLKNSDGQELEITKSAIKGMTLIQDFFDPFTSGTVSIANPYDLLEEKILFRGDGRDEFTIKFFPKKSPDEVIKGEFTLLDDGDNVNPLVRSENVKNFNLIDKKLLPFTDTIPFGKSYGGKIGAILKEIFKELLGDEAVDEEEWEDGDFVLGYTPPIYFRYIDVVYYMLKHYYAKDGEMNVKGFINFDNKKGKFQLKLISKIFEKNKDNVLEAFILGDLSGNGIDNKNNPPPQAEVSEYYGGMKNISYSTPMYGWNSEFVVNTIVHGFDLFLGVHKMAKLKIDDIKKKWEEKFVKSFKSSGGEAKPFVVKNDTTDKKFKHYRSPYPLENSSKMVEAEMYNALTFYNLQCSFYNVGSTIRESGKFLDIVRFGSDKSEGDAKLLGRWFVTSMRHNFLGDTYTNEIYCCKTYVGPTAKISDSAK